MPQFMTRFEIKINKLITPELCDEWTKHLFECSHMPVERFEKFKVIDILGKHFYPFCDKLDRVENLYKMVQIVHLFVIDDHNEIRELDVGREIWIQQLEKSLDKLSGVHFVSMSNWKPYTFMTFAIFDAIVSQYNDIQKRRVIRGLRRYYKANVIENQLTESGSIETKPAEYLIEIRKQASACMVVFVCIEYSESIIISEEEWEDDLMQQYLDIGAKCIFYTNDLYSFDKEYLAENKELKRMLNTVAINTFAQKCSVEQSKIEMAQKCEQLEIELNEISNRLISESKCSEMKKRFVHCLKYIVSANYLGSIESDRYKVAIIE